MTTARRVMIFADSDNTFLSAQSFNPAVFWLNSICASTEVGVIQGMVSGCLNVEEGLDWIYQFPQCQWHHTNTDYLTTPDCYFCGAD